MKLKKRELEDISMSKQHSAEDKENLYFFFFANNPTEIKGPVDKSTVYNLEYNNLFIKTSSESTFTSIKDHPDFAPKSNSNLKLKSNHQVIREAPDSNPETVQKILRKAYPKLSNARKVVNIIKPLLSTLLYTTGLTCVPIVLVVWTLILYYKLPLLELYYYIPLVITSIPIAYIIHLSLNSFKERSLVPLLLFLTIIFFFVKSSITILLTISSDPIPPPWTSNDPTQILLLHEANLLRNPNFLSQIPSSVDDLLLKNKLDSTPRPDLREIFQTYLTNEELSYVTHNNLYTFTGLIAQRMSQQNQSNIHNYINLIDSTSYIVTPIGLLTPAYAFIYEKTEFIR